ncbi:alpha-N-acetylneuraminide alpha-2,8-sialyltransferase isoform X1 [Gymnodraco acuticeps]|uniref:Alpha-N-acetylneuraminide alpha-2,8-sialyltransferase isoform X1 n=1 Tax=Gymnodraco acuticeps TaxID=8218 RepID=A0A6P8UCP7_GYMAC|nr:alpha-N-acetylneuraminide alpha-2,8-sialyltransferase isoform X1 [Gymnodraco acuticeps]
MLRLFCAKTRGGNMLVRCYRGKLSVWAALCVLVLCWFYIFPVYRLPRDKDIVEEVLRQGEAWQKNQTGIDHYRKLLTECCEPRKMFAVTKENSPMGKVLWYDGEFYHSRTVNNETYPLFVQVEFQSAVTNQVNHLALQMQQVLSHLKAGSSAPTPAMPDPPSVVVVSDHTTSPGSTLRLAPPERFSRDSGNCRPFLVQCELHFAHNPAAFVSDQARVAFMLSHMSGRAAAWATAEWSRNSPICQSLNMFTQTLSRVFDHSSPSREASRVIMQIKQGQQRVTDYAIYFRTLAADSGWNTPALIDAFMNGLKDSIKDQLAPHELPTDLDSIIAMAIHIDNRLHERQEERTRTSARPPSHMGRSPAFRHPWSSSPPSSASPKEPAPSAAPEEPMQLGRAKVSPE